MSSLLVDTEARWLRVVLHIHRDHRSIAKGKVDLRPQRERSLRIPCNVLLVGSSRCANLRLHEDEVPGLPIAVSSKRRGSQLYGDPRLRI